MSAESLAKDATWFWSEVKKLSGCKRGQPQTVEGNSVTDTIAELWEWKYSQALNIKDD